MLKSIKNYFDTELFKTAFSFAIIFCLLFNSAVFYHKFSYCQANILTAILEIVKDFLYNIITLTIIFCGLSINKHVFKIGTMFLFITGALASYYLFYFSISPTANMMPSIFGTHLREVYELVSMKLIIWMVFSISVCIYSFGYFSIIESKKISSFIISACCLLVFAMNIVTPKYSFFKSYFPIQYLHGSYVYFSKYFGKIVRTELDDKFKFVDMSDNDIIGVFVIGESARYDHFGINGYKRDTTPNLEKISDLMNFKAISCASTTHLSVPCMLSRYGTKDLELVESESSILSPLTRLGFQTVFIGTQSIGKSYRNKSGGSFYDEVTFSLIPGGAIAMLPNDHDEKMLPYLEQYIKNKGKKFIILHTTGSHWNYAMRYPKEFEEYKPNIETGVLTGDAASCSNEARINSYDNSILYTDFFLSEVINRLRDKKAFVIYSSDHGESLGERGILMHSAEQYVAEQREVPFMVWFSDSYKERYPRKWQSIQEKNGKEISHDYIFHSILDLLNIKSKALDKSLSLCG